MGEFGKSEILNLLKKGLKKIALNIFLWLNSQICPHKQEIKINTETIPDDKL